jgi:hypothetical protein
MHSPRTSGLTGLLFVLLGVFTLRPAVAQNVGIGTTAPGAKLTVSGAWASTPTAVAASAAPAIPDNVSHIRLTDDAAVAANAIAAPATAAEGQLLSIVNDDAQAATFAGTTIPAAGGSMSFIYINGTWRQLGATTATPAWNLLGNAGTVAGTNFLGTTDNVALDIRTNNALRARFTTSGAILMQNPSVAGNTIIGNTATATTAPTGANNTFIGN